MVDITDPIPPHPRQGEEFQVSTKSGSPPYTFVWRVDDGDNHTVHSSDGTCSLEVPRGTVGGILSIIVTDGNQEQSARSWIICVSGKEPIPIKPRPSQG